MHSPPLAEEAGPVDAVELARLRRAHVPSVPDVREALLEDVTAVARRPHPADVRIVRRRRDLRRPVVRDVLSAPREAAAKDIVAPVVKAVVAHPACPARMRGVGVELGNPTLGA